MNDYSGLEDELLCEYVDDTMDPVILEVFEEYLRLNPEVREHVECLRNTRKLLCHFGCRCHAPRDLHERLRREISCELMRAQVPFHLVLSDHLRSFATVTSAMAFLFLVGMVAGVTVFENESSAGAAARQTDVFRAGYPPHFRADRSAVPLDSRALYPRLSSFTPLPTFRSIVAPESHVEVNKVDSSIADYRGVRSSP